jgi:5'-3' exonuclease
MPRLVVLDAMGLAYRAYWAFVRRPLRTSGAKAASTATVRYRDIEAAEAQGFPFSTSSNGVIELQDEKGNVRERVAVPFGAHLLVEDGRAVPAGQPLFAENTSAIFGFASIVLKIRREENPDYWALAWDGPGPTFRHERFPDYKATRKPMPEDLLSQIGPIEDLARALGLHVLEVPGAEADDVMATLARRGEREGLEVILVTSAKDMLQLVDERGLMTPEVTGFAGMFCKDADRGLIRHLRSQGLLFREVTYKHDYPF